MLALSNGKARMIQHILLSVAGETDIGKDDGGLLRIRLSLLVICLYILIQIRGQLLYLLPVDL